MIILVLHVLYARLFGGMCFFWTAFRTGDARQVAAGAVVPHAGHTKLSVQPAPGAMGEVKTVIRVGTTASVKQSVATTHPCCAVAFELDEPWASMQTLLLSGGRYAGSLSWGGVVSQWRGSAGR
jgi:hypothetical protein